MMLHREKTFGILSQLSAARHIRENKKAVEKAINGGDATGDDLKLYERVKKRIEKHTRGVNEGQGSSYCSSDVRARPSLFGRFDPKNISLERGNLKRGASTINLKSKDPTTAAHEYGHALNYGSNGGYKKSAEGMKLTSSDFGSPQAGTRMGKEGYKKEVDKGLYHMKEESEASKNGLKILRKEGATPAQMRKSRKKLQSALDTYYHAARARSSQHMGNESEIDSFRAYKEHGKKLKEEYKKASKKILTAGRTGAERKLDAAERTTAEKVGRTLRYAGRQAQRHPGKTAAIAGVTAGVVGVGAHKAYKHYKSRKNDSA